MFRILAIGAVMPLTLIAAQAHARSEPRSVSVEYGDLNLSSTKGQQQLARRIEVAARRVCTVNGGGNANLVERGQIRACIKQARAGGLIQYAAVLERYALGG